MKITASGRLLPVAIGSKLSKAAPYGGQKSANSGRLRYIHSRGGTRGLMSNLSILSRLEDSLAAYSNGTLARGVFIAFLSNSICALEGVPLSVTHELREHEYAIEMEGYFDDEGFESQQNLAQESLFDWIQELKRIYGA
ncbi:hypothetical protein [Pseudomonas hormoni]